MDLNYIGKVLALFGVAMIVVGGIFMLGAKVPWLGRLPGDIYVQKKNFSFFFPITTSILISIAISLILIFLRHKQ